jgi:hypothetical protein
MFNSKPLVYQRVPEGIHRQNISPPGAGVAALALVAGPHWWPGPLFHAAHFRGLRDLERSFAVPWGFVTWDGWGCCGFDTFFYDVYIYIYRLIVKNNTNDNNSNYTIYMHTIDMIDTLFYYIKNRSNDSYTAEYNGNNLPIIYQFKCVANKNTLQWN